MNVGAVEQHGPHLPLITDTLLGMEVLGAALARLPDDVTVLALPPTTFGKSVEHITFPGTLTFSGDTLRMVLRDLAASVARSGFTKLVLLGSHGGNVGTTDDYFRDLRMETDLRVFKIFLGGIGNVPGLVARDVGATFELGNVYKLGLLAVGRRPEIIAARHARAHAARLFAIEDFLDRRSVALQILGRVVVDGLAGLGVDALGPGHLRHILGRLEELPVEPVERVVEAVARGVSKNPAVLAVHLGVD